MKVVGLPADGGHFACGQYRVAKPLDALSRWGLAETWWGVIGDPDDMENNPSPIEIADQIKDDMGADIVMLQRQTAPEFLELQDALQFRDIKVCYDFDDQFHKMHPSNPNYIMFGDNEKYLWQVWTKMIEKGQVHEGDLNATPEDVYRSAQGHRIGMIKQIETADFVTVTKPFLARDYSAYVKDIMVLPNCIEHRDWEGKKEKRPFGAEDKLVIGWAGSETHDLDIRMVIPAIKRISRLFNDVVFVMIGVAHLEAVFPVELIESERVILMPTMGIDEYKGFVKCFDIGMAPSIANSFNRAKSSIRLFEYALAGDEGMAVVASPVPYMDDLHTGMGLVSRNTPDEWVKHLSKYIRSEKLRLEHGRRLRQHVLDAHTYDENCYRWFEAYVTRLV